MKIPLLSPPAARRYAHFLHSRFGIPEPVMREWKWAQHQENVFVLAGKLENVIHSKANLFAAGIQAFADGKSFQPTSNFITLQGKHITQNIVEIFPVHVSSFFAQKKIPRESVVPHRVLSDGWVAVSLNGSIIGSASLTRTHLIPNLPGLSHGNESE